MSHSAIALLCIYKYIYIYIIHPCLVGYIRCVRWFYTQFSMVLCARKLSRIGPVEENRSHGWLLANTSSDQSNLNLKLVG
jgi:fido (protein-threonine AMPylation protein)